jgi:hypothetical protein
MKLCWAWAVKEMEATRSRGRIFGRAVFIDFSIWFDSLF